MWIDAFTKFAESILILNKNAEMIAKVLMKEMFPRFGLPQIILFDLGNKFENQIMRHIYTRLGVIKLCTIAYKLSTTNGCIERANDTIHVMLAKVVSENQKDWCQHLPSDMAAYRVSRHEAKGYLPNILMFGREVLGPADLVYCRLLDGVDETRSPDDYTHELWKKYRSWARSMTSGSSCQKSKELFWHACQRMQVWSRTVSVVV